MPATPCHILVEGNPAIIYATRNGTPDKVFTKLKQFLEKFWQERDALGETEDTPECLVAQIIVRFAFEICEDDYSNLRVGIQFKPAAKYLYEVRGDRSLRVWVAEDAYHSDPQMGISGCREWVDTSAAKV